VSLHSHTSHSRESLEFIPQYARRSKFLGKVIDLAQWQYHSQTGNRIDFGSAYWTPPLAPDMALELESEQIRKLGLTPLVSLSDHDNCEAGLDTGSPVSIEWTLPCPPSFFHLGVHNLPAPQARAITADMNAYTASPQPARLEEMLAMLNDFPDVLLVLNHPLWDEGLIGAEQHAALLETFLQRHCHRIHALELNGLRPAAENERVAALAARVGLPAVSGGDRHGREPNANLNLTRASSFAEFVHEVRRQHLSEVLYMPQYREMLPMRQFETAWDILRDDERSKWCERVYFKNEEGVTRPLSFYFGSRGPGILVPFLAVMHLLEKPAVRPVLRLALGG
jgi:hypothetical protein